MMDGNPLEDAPDLTKPVSIEGLSLPPRERTSAPRQKAKTPPSPKITSKPAPAKAKTQPAPEAGIEIEEVQRPSNLAVTPELAEQINAYCKLNQVPRGMLIVKALEATYEQLPQLIKADSAGAVGGGGLFAPWRPTRIHHSQATRVTLNFRMRSTDFDTLDRLVDELGARSRVHLITTALAAYLNNDN